MYTKHITAPGREVDESMRTLAIANLAVVVVVFLVVEELATPDISWCRDVCMCMRMSVYIYIYYMYTHVSIHI